MLETIQSIYTSLLGNFPVSYHPIISVALGIVLLIAIIQTLRQNLIWLVVVVVLLPASVPILRGVADFLIVLFKFLFGLEQTLQ